MHRKSKCSIVACGGGGCNVLSESSEHLSHIATLYAVDSHSEDLSDKFESNTHVRLFSIPRPDSGQAPDPDQYDADYLTRVPVELDELISALKKASLPVIINVSLGGMTGGITAIRIAASCTCDELDVRIVATLPFDLETEIRRRRAKNHLAHLSDYVTLMVVLRNHRPMNQAGELMTLRESFETLNDRLNRCTQTVLGL